MLIAEKSALLSQDYLNRKQLITVNGERCICFQMVEAIVMASTNTY